jgi:spoIIIJ-associated protein
MTDVPVEQADAATKPSSNSGDSAERSDSRRSGRRAPRADEPPPDLGAATALAHTFMDGLLDAAGLQGTTTITVVDGEVLVDVAGKDAAAEKDLGLFIGPKGQTLLAVQDLARAVVSRRDIGYVPLRLDVAGYWAARREALGRFVREEIAPSVVSSGMARVLEPMSAADRKIVHDALSEVDGITTRSQGEDPHRRVVIAPA